MGGKLRNMSNSQSEDLTGRGPVGRTAVVRARYRSTRQVAAKVVTSTGEQMASIASGMEQSQFRYKDLLRPNGLASGARMVAPPVRPGIMTAPQQHCGVKTRFPTAGAERHEVLGGQGCYGWQGREPMHANGSVSALALAWKPAATQKLEAQLSVLDLVNSASHDWLGGNPFAVG